MGYPDQALAMCHDGEALARALAHPFSLTIALWASGILSMMRRDTVALREADETMIAHSIEKGFPPFVPMGRMFHGGVMVVEGDLDQGIEVMREGIAGVRATGNQYALPTFFVWLAGACAAAGRIEPAQAALDEGLAMSERNADRFSLPEFHRIEGEMKLVVASPGEAEACFERAMASARDLDARTLELRAATSLSRLWQAQGKIDAARDLLAPLHRWFTEGFDTADLKDAKALLDELK